MVTDQLAAGTRVRRLGAVLRHSLVATAFALLFLLSSSVSAATPATLRLTLLSNVMSSDR
jgi:hypothetical protein